MSKLHARMLERANDLLGSEAAVSAYLGVSVARLRVWMNGRISPPDDVFLKLVDLVNEPPPSLARRRRRVEKPK